jgi:hypothetical protein
MNTDVTKFLDQQNHPLRAEIDLLRKIILDSENELVENIKWNSPNYAVNNEDRITMRIYPPKQIQLIFHRGAKKQEQPATRIIDDKSGLLVWKENDRAVATFKNSVEILAAKPNLETIVRNWIMSAK